MLTLLNPTYIVKLGLQGIHYFLFLLENIDVAEAVLTSTHNLCFEQKYEKISELLYLKIFSFGDKIFSIFKWACFRNVAVIMRSHWYLYKRGLYFSHLPRRHLRGCVKEYCRNVFHFGAVCKNSRQIYNTVFWKPVFQKCKRNSFLKSSSILTLMPLNSTFKHVSLLYSDAYK